MNPGFLFFLKKVSDTGVSLRPLSQTISAEGGRAKVEDWLRDLGSLCTEIGEARSKKKRAKGLLFPVGTLMAAAVVHDRQGSIFLAKIATALNQHYPHVKHPQKGSTLILYLLTPLKIFF
jgi:hypothetical protein